MSSKDLVFPSILWKIEDKVLSFYSVMQDYFDIAGAASSNSILSAASFFYRTISYQWTQHKRCHQGTDPISWSDFKIFLRKNLSESRPFVNNIWRKFRRDFWKKAWDWVFHLEHLQSSLWKFDSDGAPKEFNLIRFFWKGFKPSIKAQIE